MDESRDADDIDCHITFPALSRLSSDDSEEAKEPVIVLLGWLGCKDKHLLKYVEIYEGRCVTIRYIVPPEVFWSQPHKLPGIAYKILELIMDMNLEENPIFFHMFSNGGGRLYRHIVDQLTSVTEFRLIDVAGCIMDSCPSRRTPRQAARVFKNTSPLQPWPLRYFGAALLYVYIWVSDWVSYVKSWFWKPPQSYFDSLRFSAARWPQLFLYSLADAAVDADDVTECADTRRALGVEVREVCWDDSPHVQHLLRHRESYINNCLRFVGDFSGGADTAVKVEDFHSDVPGAAAADAYDTDD